MASPIIERLRSLENIERDIATALETAGLAAAELSKDKPNAKTTESHSQAFLKTVNSIESSLMKQLDYLSQVVTAHPHTGSSYGPQKDAQMAVQRKEYVASRLDEMDKLRVEQSSHRQPSELRRALSHHSQFPPIGTAVMSQASGTLTSQQQQIQ